MNIVLPYIKGLFLIIVLTFLSVLLANISPLGGVTVGIILGILIGNTVDIPDSFKPGIKFSEKQLLSYAIILMGVKLNYNIVQELGFTSVFIVISSIAFTIFTSILLSKVFNFNPRLGLLLGIGNGICGSSAIAATEKIIDAEKDEVAISVTIVNFLGTLGIFLLPFITTVVLKYTQIHSSFLIGSTLQAVGQVVAAGFSVSPEVGHTATIVKMIRILMLTPVVISLLFVSFYKKRKGKQLNLKKVQKPKVPFFIIGFILFSFVPTFQILSQNTIGIISKASHYLLIMAMVAIGLGISFKSLLKNGKKALWIGALLFLLQIVYNTFMIYFFL